MRVARACFALGLLVLLLCAVQESCSISTRPVPAPRAGRCRPARAPIVYTAEVDGIIHPVATAYVRAGDCRGRRREGRRCS